MNKGCQRLQPGREGKAAKGAIWVAETDVGSSSAMCEVRSDPGTAINGSRGHTEARAEEGASALVMLRAEVTGAAMGLDPCDGVVRGLRVDRGGWRPRLGRELG